MIYCFCQKWDGDKTQPNTHGTERRIFMRNYVRKWLAFLLTAAMLFSMAAAAVQAEEAQSIADFSGRNGEWEKVSYSKAGFHNSLISMKAYQQIESDGSAYLYIAVEAEEDGFGTNPVVYIDDCSNMGENVPKFAVTAWSGASRLNNPGDSQLRNNQISHRIVLDGGEWKFEKWVSGSGSGAVWEAVADSAMECAASSTFAEFKVPVSELGLRDGFAQDMRRVGYFNGEGLYIPEAGKAMMLVDAPFIPLNEDNTPEIAVDGDPSDWLEDGKPNEALRIWGKTRNMSEQTDYALFGEGSSVYGFRKTTEDADMLYFLIFGNKNFMLLPGENGYARNPLIFLNTDGREETGYAIGWNNQGVIQGGNYLFEGRGDGEGQNDNYEYGNYQGYHIIKFLTKGWDVENVNSTSAEPYKTSGAVIRREGQLGHEAYAAFVPENVSEFGLSTYDWCGEFSIDLNGFREESGEEEIVSILKVNMVNEPSHSYFPGGFQSEAPIPCAEKYAFVIDGEKGEDEWEGLNSTNVSYAGSDAYFYMTTDGQIVYTMVLGTDMNTQNVYYIDCKDGGYDLQGRSGVDYYIANGYLYQPARNRTSDTPEDDPRAVQLSRVSMEYWPDCVLMQFRLDQIGCKDPYAIKISYLSKGTVNIPIDASEYVALTDSFVRDNQNTATVYYPAEDYEFIPNPLKGQAPDTYPTGDQTMCYMYMSWTDIEPAKGEYAFNEGSVYERLAYCKENGFHCNLRLFMDYPRGYDNRYIPDWLYDELNAWIDPATGETFPVMSGNPNQEYQPPVPAGNYYDSTPEVGKGFAPNYAHPLLISYHEKLINALAEEIAKPDSVWSAVSTVQIGSLGHWGEFHNWPDNEEGPFPKMSISDQYVSHYIEAFKDNPEVTLGIRYAQPIAAQNNIGYFNDTQGQLSEAQAFINWFNFGRSAEWVYADTYPQTDEGQAQFMADSSNPDCWKTAWMGGEYGNAGRTDSQSDNGVMNYLWEIRNAHYSTIGPRGSDINAKVTDAGSQTARKNIDAIYDLMGYRFVLEKVEIKSVQKNGGDYDFEIELTVNNKGVAPFYRNWPVQVSVDAYDIEPYTALIQDINISEWMPGRTVAAGRFTLPGEAAEVNGRLALSILDVYSGEPAVQFNNISERLNSGRTLVTGINVKKAVDSFALPE